MTALRAGGRSPWLALIATAALAGLPASRATGADLPDTDGDGASDFVEDAAGTDPGDPGDNPQANGDAVFVVPYQAPPAPAAADLDVVGQLQALDVYVILDRSGSMISEITNVRANLAAAISGLNCPPLGTGDPATCIPDLWAGAGTVGYSGSGIDTFRHFVDLQPFPSLMSIPTTEPGGCCAEPLTFSVFAAITGLGSASATGCGLAGVAARASCAGSPAANGGFDTFGYPCFREGALPVILLATDEAPLNPSGDTNKCPSWSAVVLPQMANRHARLVGIYGSGSSASTITDLQTMAVATGAVDAANGNAPLVFNGADANATVAIENGIRTLASSVPIDLAALLADDPSDAIDTRAAFVDHLETLQLGTPECTSMLTEIDTNADTFPDAYVGVRSGTSVCWRLAAKPNELVPAVATPQLFRASIRVAADAVTTVDTRDVFFVIPPAPEPESAAQLATSVGALLAIARARRASSRDRAGANGRNESHRVCRY